MGETVEPASVNALITQAFSGGPAYDSGWVRLQQDESRQLWHNLGGNLNNYVVIMDYKADDVNEINQRYYGGADFGEHPPGGKAHNDRVGAYWRDLTTHSIIVYRRPEDTYANAVRIRIWMDPYPAYDSGWVSLSPGAAATTLHHNLGGNPDDYVVDMQYRNSGSGVNQRYYGGVDFGSRAFHGSHNNDRVGAYWRSLNNNNITIYRRPDDIYAQQVRIRIWRRPRPTYDSGWVNINPNSAKTLAHRIRGNPDHYVVDMQYRNSGSGVNQRYYGGMDIGHFHAPGLSEDARMGAYWRTLRSNTIAVYRRPDDIYAQQVRIRIWHYWQPTAPDYDSRWFSLNVRGVPLALTHHTGGNPNDYLVDMTYKVTNANGVNQRYYGGIDFGSHPTSTHAANDRVGTYWRSLTNTHITIFRRANDTYSSKVRLRIWKMPKPDYDSGWVSINPNQSKQFNHRLSGSVYDYLVDLQYRSSANGVNQRYYGGMDVGHFHPASTNENDRVGVYWRSLNNNNITVYRRPDDIYAQQVRIRIWRMAQPSYDSTWTIITRDQVRLFPHKLDGNPDNYLLQMWQYDTNFNFTNQRHYGGADFGTHPPAGYNPDDRVGAYWRSLNRSGVTVYRRPEDGFADRVRIRIWDYNRRQYLPIYRK